MFFYSTKMGELTEIAQPDVLVKLVPSLEPELADIKEFKKDAWGQGKVGYTGRRSYGNLGGYGKCVARIPGRLLQALLLAEPDLIKDDEKFERWLSENPLFDMSKT